MVFSGILWTFNRSIPRPAKSSMFGALRCNEGGRAGHAHQILLLLRSTAGAESASWLGSAQSRCGIFSTAPPPASPPSYVWAIGAGHLAAFPLAPPPWPLSLTVPRIHPLCRYKPSSRRRCLHHGEAQHSSPCATDTIPEASGHDEEHSEDYFCRRHR